MSKSSTSRLRQRLIEQRAEDFGSVDAEQAETLLDAKIEEGRNSSILEKLKSMQKEEKEWACSSLTHCVRDDTEATLNSMDKAEAWSGIVECLCDSEPLVVCAALGLVHACTVSGNPDVQLRTSHALVGAGVLTPIIILAGKSALLPTDSPAERPVKVQILSRLLSVMCNLASLNDTALGSICSSATASDILAFCMTPLQQRDLHTPEIIIYASQLLSILTDVELDTSDQTRLASTNFRQLFNDDARLLLKVTMANGTNPILLRSLCVNVLMNLSLEPGGSAESVAMFKTVLPVITVALDSFDGADQLLQLDMLRERTNMGDKAAVKNLDDSAQLWKDALDAQGLILEMLANILILGDDAGPEDVEFLEMDESQDSNQLGVYQGRPLYSSLSSFTVASDITSRLLPKCFFVQRYSSSPDHPLADDNDMLSLQHRAVGCLLNAVSNPDFEETTLVGASALWRELVDRVCAPASERALSGNAGPEVHDILANSLAILAQLLRVVAHASAQESICLEQDVQGFITIANSSLCPDHTRLTALTLLGLIVGGGYTDHNIASQVLALLSDAMTNASSIIVATEAANALMDAFAEPQFNSISEATLVPLVTQFIATLKSKINLEKKNLTRIDLDRMDETRVNLNRFLAYKRSQT